jgi:hypothetical protein
MGREMGYLRPTFLHACSVAKIGVKRRANVVKRWRGCIVDGYSWMGTLEGKIVER